MSSMVPEGLRHLRNFAKKRHALDLLKVIYQYVNQVNPKDAEKMPPTGLRPGDMSEYAEIVKATY